MDLTDIMQRHDAAAAKWHKIKDAEFLIRLPTRRQVVEMVTGVDAAAPSVSEMFLMVDRCLGFVQDWRGMVGADGAEVPFDPELLQALVDDDVEIGQELVSIVMGEFNAREAQVVEEKKA